MKDIEWNEFEVILKEIYDTLFRNEMNGQAIIIANILSLVKEKKIIDFRKSINSIDMWGGAGAVWEVYIADKTEEIKFESDMIKLINLMERTEILGKGIKPIRKIFESNIKI